MGPEKAKQRFLDGEKLSEGKGRKERDEDRRDSPTSLPGSLRQPLPSLARVGRGYGQGSPLGRPCRRSLGEKLGGRIVISLGVLLNYYSLLHQPGGTAGGQTDGWTDRRGQEGGEGRVAPIVEKPRHGPHRHESLWLCGEGRGGPRKWVPGPRNPGPRPPPSPRNPGVSLLLLPPPKDPNPGPPSPTAPEFKSPSPQAPPLLPRGPRRPGPGPSSSPGIQPGLSRRRERG